MNRGILDLLRADGSITINKKLIQLVGLIGAAVYSELASRYHYFKDRGRLTDGGYFFNTKEDLEEATGVTRRQQDTAVKELMEMGILEMKVMGIPASRHFRFTDSNLKKVSELLFFEAPAEKQPEDLLVETFQGFCKDQLTPDIVEDIKKQARKSQARQKATAKWTQQA